MKTQCEILLGEVQKSHFENALKSSVFLVHLCPESWRMTFSCMHVHAESKSNKLSHKVTWKCQNMHQEEQWFQHDSATPHTANITMQWLNLRFVGRQQSSHCRMAIPFTRLDFYLWGYLKEWYSKRRMCYGYRQLCSSMPSAPKRTFRKCLVKFWFFNLRY